MTVAKAGMRPLIAMVHDALRAKQRRSTDPTPDLTRQGFSAMSQPTVDQTAKANAEALTKSGNAAGKIAQASGATLTASGNASSAAFETLAKAYQEMASKNAETLKAAMQALAAVKNPAEFIELQQRLIKDGVQSAVRDAQNIAHLTAAVFTAAFDPVKQQIEAAQKTALN